MNLPKTPKIPFEKRPQGILRKKKLYMVSLVLSLVFKTVFGIFLASLVCLISVK
jgi:hypothetical protein